MENTPDHPVNLTRYAWLSIGAAVVTISMKATAYTLTGSVGMLSDALESLVNLAAAIVALISLRILIRPANDEFTFGFSKVEYFSSGFEGGMILIASVSIIISALPRLINPVPLEQVGLGLLISVIASLINLGVALVLMRAGKRYNSITLEADARHLMTDVWTTGGVLIGVAPCINDWLPAPGSADRLGCRSQYPVYWISLTCPFRPGVDGCLLTRRRGRRGKINSGYIPNRWGSLPCTALPAGSGAQIHGRASTCPGKLDSPPGSPGCRADRNPDHQGNPKFQYCYTHRTG